MVYLLYHLLCYCFYILLPHLSQTTLRIVIIFALNSHFKTYFNNRKILNICMQISLFHCFSFLGEDLSVWQHFPSASRIYFKISFMQVCFLYIYAWEVFILSSFLKVIPALYRLLYWQTSLSVHTWKMLLCLLADFVSCENSAILIFPSPYVMRF